MFAEYPGREFAALKERVDTGREVLNPGKKVRWDHPIHGFKIGFLSGSKLEVDSPSPGVLRILRVVDPPKVPEARATA